jgi:hypothetical protein
MGLEDAGTMAWLLKKMCVNYKGELKFEHYDRAVQLYEKIRIPRTSHILDCSKELGRMEEMREDERAAEELEEMIKGELLMNGTLPIMFQGATHHYRESVDKEIREFELEQERIAISMYMPGASYEPSEAERKRMLLREEEEKLRAFEAIMYGGQ